MKTIEDAATEYAEGLNYSIEAKHYMCPADFNIAFNAGAKFVQKWIVIEKDNDGFSTYDQMNEMNANLPFLLKGEKVVEQLYHEVDDDINKEKYTHWRPVNLK